MKSVGDIQVETLDMGEFRSPDQAYRRAFVAQLKRAFQEIGFVVIKNHAVSTELQKQTYEKIAEFFKLPMEKKVRYEIKGAGGARGYTTFGKEHAKDSKLADLKEFYHYGMDLPEGHPLEKEYVPNVSVQEVPHFNDTLKALYDSLLGLGLDMLRAIALGLDLDEEFFTDQVRYGNSILRPIHYPPLTGKEPAGSLRAAPHEDINLITLLIGASSPGLQVKHRTGRWVDITTEPTEIVVNVGDMLQRLTNYKFVSTTHQVINPPFDPSRPGDTRFSIPFFVHPVPTMDLTPLKNCIDDQHPPKDPPIFAGAYLDQRLREIGLL